MSIMPKREAPMNITFSKELYPKTALLKAAYNFTDKTYVHLDSTPTHYIVSLTAKDGEETPSKEEFDNEMLCQSLRHEVYEQTKTIRELLVARSLSSTMVEIEPQEGDDEADHGYEAAAILSDWFDGNDKS